MVENFITKLISDERDAYSLTSVYTDLRYTMIHFHSFKSGSAELPIIYSFRTFATVLGNLEVTVKRELLIFTDLPELYFDRVSAS